MSTEPTPRKRGRPKTESGTPPQHQFRCPDDEWALFERAAEQNGQSVASWLRTIAVKIAEKQLSKK